MNSNNDTGNQIPEPLEGCHFPVSTAASSENNCWKEIPISDIDDHLVAGCRLYGSSDAFLRAAWHSLLHIYIGEDSTSFAFFNSGNIDCLSETTCRDTNSHAASRGSVWVYHSSGNCNEDLQPDLDFPLCDADIEKSALNTAIYTCSTSSDETYAHWAQSQYCCREMKMFDIILFANTGTNKANLTVCFRWPRLPFLYGQAVTDSFRSILALLPQKATKGLLENSDSVNVQKILEWQPGKILDIRSCVNDEIDKVTDSIPLQEAVCAWDGSLTYRELWRLSSIIANHLLRMGLSRGSFVPFVFEKSIWAVVAALAIIKSGGALIPMNPDHPKDRQTRILESVNARIAVTSETYACLLGGFLIDVVTVSSENVSEWAKENHAGVQLPQLTPQDPIFVLFTSGSTGEPKGMIHEHGGICSHATGQIHTMGYRGARVFQFAAFTFDVAMMDIFTTLMAGGCVCVPSDNERTSNMAGAMERMGVDHALLTPSIAALLDPRDVPSLKILALAGESLSQSHIDNWMHHVWLMNAYGPAEVGVCTLSNIDRDTRPETIGRPISHSCCWVVNRDDSDQLVPIGAVGELLVSGTTIARGYLNNKKKSEASFIRPPRWADQFGMQHMSFYKTGDLVRYNIGAFDGSLDYIGRKDTQIKIRGQRVELGDIEHHLATVPGAYRSIVCFPKDGFYAGSLVAVVQSRGGLEIDSTEPLCLDDQHLLEPSVIQQHLSSSLLSHMIPTEFLIVRSLPLDPSCKTDRKRVDHWLAAFSPPSTGFFQTKQKASALLNPSETIARAICDKVCDTLLQKHAPGAKAFQGHDFSLLGLGLDSIQLMSISMHIQKKFNVFVSISHLNSPHCTVRGLADFIKMNKTDQMCPTVNVVEESNIILKMLTMRLSSSSLTTVVQAQEYSQNVLLTGASGFLGQEILRQLLLHPDIHVFALMRCSPQRNEMERLRKIAKMNGWWHDTFAARIHIWSGDLSKQQLGLSLSARKQLAGLSTMSENINTIIHCGALVQYNYDYGSLKATNVDSTTYLMEMTAKSRSIEAFLYVSGGVTPNTHQSDGLTAEELALTNGYAQSKLVSELVVRRCAEDPAFQGRRIRIVRPGYIIGSAANPTAVQTDFIWRLVAACVRMESYNGSNSSQWLYISDVERVAKRMTAAIFERHGQSIMDAVWDGLPVGEFWSLLATDFGYTLQPLNESQWLERLTAAIAQEEQTHPLFPFLHVLEKELKSVGSMANFNTDNAPIRNAIHDNIQSLVTAGFLPAPPCLSGLQYNCAVEDCYPSGQLSDRL